MKARVSLIKRPAQKSSKKRLFEEALKFIYPAFCLHCDEEVIGSRQLLCSECMKHIEWVKKSCIYCALPIEEGKCCVACQKRPLFLQPHTSLFIPYGPITSLHAHLIQAKKPDTLASLVIIGLNRLSLPAPDIVVPLLRPRHEGFSLKKQPAALLAKSVAKMLNCSTSLPSPQIEQKTVLLITDLLDNGKVLQNKKQELSAYFPEKIYSIACIDRRFPSNS